MGLAGWIAVALWIIGMVTIQPSIDDTDLRGRLAFVVTVLWPIAIVAVFVFAAGEVAWRWARNRIPAIREAIGFCHLCWSRPTQICAIPRRNREPITGSVCDACAEKVAARLHTATFTPKRNASA